MQVFHLHIHHFSEKELLLRLILFNTFLSLRINNAMRLFEECDLETLPSYTKAKDVQLILKHLFPIGKWFLSTERQATLETRRLKEGKKEEKRGEGRAGGGSHNHCTYCISAAFKALPASSFLLPFPHCPFNLYR